VDLLVVDYAHMGGTGEAREHHIMYCMLLNRVGVDEDFIFDDVASRVDRPRWDG
jgi:hypothetical protein